MAWTMLIIAGLFETVWAVALSMSQGFRRRGPTVLFVIAFILSIGSLAYAMTEIPTGTAYAVFAGIGASLTVLWGIVTGTERATVARALLLIALIGSVIGLKVVS